MHKTVLQQLQSRARVQGATPQFSPGSIRVLQEAYAYAQRRGDQYVATFHLLWALVSANSTISQMLNDAGFTPKN